MEGERGAVEWASFVLICASATLAAVLELVFLAQFYIGTVLVPAVILVAIVGNVVLPRMAKSVLGSVKGALVPMALWLVVILVPMLYTRPEGDVLVLAEHGQQYAFYGLLFGGAIAGFCTIIALGTPSR